MANDCAKGRRTSADNPLTPALIELLHVCLSLQTTDTKELAEFLCRAPSTVATQFKRIGEILGTHSRFQAIIVALAQGFIQVPALKISAREFSEDAQQNIP